MAGIASSLEKVMKKKIYIEKGYCPLIVNTLQDKCVSYVRDKLTIYV